LWLCEKNLLGSEVSAKVKPKVLSVPLSVVSLESRVSPRFKVECLDNRVMLPKFKLVVLDEEPVISSVKVPSNLKLFVVGPYSLSAV
jgi:hypothetical protein